MRPGSTAKGKRRATTRGYGQQGPPLKVGRRWLVGRPAACIRAPRRPSTQEAREQTPPPQRGIKLWVSRPGREAGAEGQGTVVAANHVRRILRATVGKAEGCDPPWGQDTGARGRWRGALATPSTTSSTLLGPAGALGGRFGQGRIRADPPKRLHIWARGEIVKSGLPKPVGPQPVVLGHAVEAHPCGIPRPSLPGLLATQDARRRRIRAPRRGLPLHRSGMAKANAGT